MFRYLTKHKKIKFNMQDIYRGFQSGDWEPEQRFKVKSVINFSYLIVIFQLQRLQRRSQKMQRVKLMRIFILYSDLFNK
jgi:hypothetical protein